MSETCFTSVPTIGVNVYRWHPRNINHVQKYSNYILLAIIMLGKWFRGNETVFVWNKNKLYGEKLRVLMHSHGRCVVGAFGRILTKVLCGLETEQWYHLLVIYQYYYICTSCKWIWSGWYTYTRHYDIYIMIEVVWNQNNFLKMYTIK